MITVFHYLIMESGRKARILLPAHGAWDMSERPLRTPVGVGLVRMGVIGMQMASKAFSVQNLTEHFRWDLCVGAYLSFNACPSGWLVCCLLAVVWHTGKEWGAQERLGMTREVLASPRVMWRLGVDVCASPRVLWDRTSISVPTVNRNILWGKSPYIILVSG